MIQINEIIKNGTITTMKGILLRDKNVIHFLFNGNHNDFHIDTKMVTPDFGLFEINNFTIKEVDLTVEEMNEILGCLSNEKVEKANEKKIIGKVESPVGCIPIYEGDNPINIIQNIIKKYVYEDNIIVAKDIESSLIETICYNKQLKTLVVLFRPGSSIYEYSGVPQEVVEELLESDSKGRYFNKYIRGKYKYTQVQ